jgi:hypothetical protein
MTYPPQQPGPYGQDPYGQQPNPYGQQPGQQPPGQQPGWGQPQPQQPYGQFAQDPYNAPDPYAQPQFPGGEPPKGGKGKIIAIVAIAVLVLAGAGAGVYFLTKSSSPDSSSGSGAGGSTTSSKPAKTTGSSTSSSEEPTSTSKPTRSTKATTTTNAGSGGGGADFKSAASKYVDAVNSKDEPAAIALSCEGDEAGLLYSSAAPHDGKVKLVGEPDMFSDDSGTISTEVTLSGADPIPFPILMEKQAKGWCVTI